MSDQEQDIEHLHKELHVLQARLAEYEREREDRRLAEEALRQSEDRYRQMFENNQATKLLINPKTGALVDANSAAVRFYGYSLEKLRQMHIGEINALPKAELQALIRRAVTEKQSSFQVPHRLASGEIRTVQVFTGVVHIGDQDYLYSIIHDVSERIRTENELRESENRLRLILEQIPAVLWTTDRNMRFTSGLGAGLKALGLLPSQLIGVSLAEYFRTDDPEYLPIANHRRALLGESVAYELDWAGRTYQSHLEPLRDAQGETTGIIGIALDITERKRAEDDRLRLESQIQASQKMESLGVLAGGIAHDFNNLLTGILGNASLAGADLPENSEIRYSLQQIESAAHRAADLTRQMLAYSGRGRFVIQPVNLSEVVKDLTPLLRSAISKKAVLHFELADNLPFVKADQGQIKQIVMNLIANASDALSEETGLITLRTGILTLTSDLRKKTVVNDDLAEGPFAFLEIIDTGCGMDETTKLRIFDPFFSTKFTGRGLGLAAVLGIVRGHKGTICVSTAVGRGTSIQVLLPCMDERIGALDKKGEHPSPTGHTILVIDDEPAVRSLSKSILERSGYRVVLASNGQSGIDLFQANPAQFSAVLLDLTMPEKDGEEVFDEIRLLWPKTKVVLMSGYSLQEVTRRFAGKGLAGFLQKPFRPSEVLEALGQVISQKTDQG